MRRLTEKVSNAGWSSLVARQAHNLKVVGSNPTPATKCFWAINENHFINNFLIFNYIFHTNIF